MLLFICYIQNIFFFLASMKLSRGKKRDMWFVGASFCGGCTPYRWKLKAEVSRISGCNAQHICVLGRSTQGKIDYWQVKVKGEALNWQEVYSEDVL